MSSGRSIRRCTADDYEALAAVMFDAVRNGPSAYSEQQRRAWLPRPCGGPDWSKRLSMQTIFAAEEWGRLLGFLSLARGGYIDLAFIRPTAQGTGLFRELYRTLEDQAREDQELRLWLHASVTAQPAFSTVGFTVIREQTIRLGDQALRRFEMQKWLDPANSIDGAR